MDVPVLPEGVEYVRTTDVFDNDTVPHGLLRAHRVAPGVWGRLIVHSGSVVMVFEDQADQPITVGADEAVAIAPQRPHHVELGEPATFAVEFYRWPVDTPIEIGTESTGLTGGDPTDDE